MSMRSKVICFWSVVQIMIGFLLLGGTVFLSTAVLPRIRANVAMVGDKVSDAAAALRAVNASYCQSATNLFNAAENLADVSKTLGQIGWNLKETGRSLHFDVPVMKQLNGVGDSVREIGRGIVNVSVSILTQSNIIRGYRSDGHVKTALLISDSAKMLDDVAVLLKSIRSMTAYDWFVCALGVLVSILFITNGLVLVSIASRFREEDVR